MIGIPADWNGYYDVPHKWEWHALITCTDLSTDEQTVVDYGPNDIFYPPEIIRPMTESPSIGGCCSSTLNISIFPKDGYSIPKASKTLMYITPVRKSDGEAAPSRMPMGAFFISRRTQNGKVLTLECRDSMLLTGTTYLDKTAFTEWPQSMRNVVSEIATLIGCTVDDITQIGTGSDFVVSRPNEDTLISEVLSGIAAAHGGNFIIKQTGALSLQVFRPGYAPVESEEVYGSSYIEYAPRKTSRSITRITLTDSSENQFSAGEQSGDSDIELTAFCDYATQATTNAAYDALRFGSETYSPYIPYTIRGLYAFPGMELGDSFSIVDSNGDTQTLCACYMRIDCTQNPVWEVSNEVPEDDEDEYPYISKRDIDAKRYVKMDVKYFGNRINRTEGFVSEYVLNGNPVARLIANANTFSMQQLVNGSWADRIYFDPVKAKYVLTGDVEINGVLHIGDLDGYVTQAALSTSGSTTIHGGNITTGTISAERLDLSGVLKVGALDGYVTKTNLSTSGQTTIHGGNITTGTINVKRITLIGYMTNSDGRFKIDSNGYLSCSGATIKGTLQCGTSTSTGLYTFDSSGMTYQYGSKYLRIYGTNGYMYIATPGTGLSIRSSIDMLSLYGKNGVLFTGIINDGGPASVNETCYVYFQGGSTTTTAVQILPYTSNSGIIGDQTRYWNTVWTEWICAMHDLYKFSSREKKHNIQPLEDYGDRIDLLKPVTFVYNGDETNRIQTGLIYEDTIDILPVICVNEDGPSSSDDKPKKGITYLTLVPILLKEIQSLRKRVKQLESVA